jgi:hypothetical protein
MGKGAKSGTSGKVGGNLEIRRFFRLLRESHAGLYYFAYTRSVPTTSGKNLRLKYFQKSRLSFRRVMGAHT